MAKKKAEQKIEIKRPDFRYMDIEIVGERPLNIHRLGKKLEDEFRARDKDKPVKKKQVRDYQAEFEDSLYYIDKNFKETKAPNKITASTRFGFPASGFKKAMVGAGRNFKGVEMTKLRGRFFVENEFVEIKGKPVKDEFWRRIGGKGSGTGTPDIGVRAVFPEWSATLHLKYNADVISAESVINLLYTAGFSDGIGEDRPNKSGNSFGTWTIK